MKPAIFLISALVLPLVGLSQDYSQAELAKSLIENEKMTIITESMNLTEVESQAFWPVYHDFEKEWEKIFNQKVELLNRYADNYNRLNDESAIEMIEDLLDIQANEAKIRKDYLKKFQKVLSGKKVARYFQLENKMAAVINYDLAEIVPLVE